MNNKQCIDPSTFEFYKNLNFEGNEFYEDSEIVGSIKYNWDNTYLKSFLHNKRGLRISFKYSNNSILLEETLYKNRILTITRLYNEHGVIQKTIFH